MGFVKIFPRQANSPTVKLEWAPDASPADDPIGMTWVDITSRWRALEWSYGRNDELGSFEAGRGYVVLDNSDRVFDPTYTAGTWYGRLKPRRPFHFTMGNVGGTALRDLVFYARGFPQSWPAQGFDAITRVDLVDLLTVAQSVEFPVGYSRPEEKVSDRISAVATTFNFPASVSNSSTTVAALSVTDAGQSALSHLRQVIESDGGCLYQGLGGYMFFQSKQQAIQKGAAADDDTTGRWLFTDRSIAGGTLIPYTTDFEFVQDDNYLFNAATVTGSGEVIGAAAGTTSQAEFNTLSKSYSTLLAKNTEAEDLAQYAVYRYSQPVMRAPTIAVDLASCGTLSQNHLLGLDAEIYQPCQIRRFDTTANPIVLYQKVEGISYSASPGRFQMQFATSPADLTTYWTLETSTLGTMDSTNLIAP